MIEDVDSYGLVMFGSGIAEPLDLKKSLVLDHKDLFGAVVNSISIYGILLHTYQRIYQTFINITFGLVNTDINWLANKSGLISKLGLISKSREES